MKFEYYQLPGYFLRVSVKFSQSFFIVVTKCLIIVSTKNQVVTIYSLGNIVKYIKWRFRSASQCMCVYEFQNKTYVFDSVYHQK